MGAYIFDFTIVAVLVVVLTALMGVITNGLGEKLFGGKQKSEFVDEANKYITGWKSVGGKNKA